MILHNLPFLNAPATYIYNIIYIYKEREERERERERERKISMNQIA